jgi:hypothetical protein
MLYGFVAGLTFAQLGSFTSVTLLVGGLGVTYLAFRFVDARVEAIQKERMHYVRGARGEEFVGWLLEDLPAGWHVFHGIQLNEGRDLDHIVVGPGGIFLISTKSYRGLFTQGAVAGEVLWNGQPTAAVGQACNRPSSCGIGCAR